LAKKPSEVRTAEKKWFQEIRALITQWETEVDAALDEQALPPGQKFQWDLVCASGTNQSVQSEAIKKLVKLYKDAGWKDIQVGPCINLTGPGFEGAGHLTLGIPDLKVVAKDKVEKAKVVKK
jgi:hypothetical protein